MNESVLESFKQFLETYDSGKSGPNVKTSPVSDISAADLSDEMVVLRYRTATDSCMFSEHTISPNDVEPEVFDWIFYHLDYKKCPHPLAFALASIVARKLGLAATTRESHNSDADKSKPAISSNELYSHSLEYLTEYINSWKLNPEIAVEIAKEYSSQTFVSSICAIKNSRRKMEDRHVVLPDLNKALSLKTAKQYSYYAIFDGHAGVDAASYASAHLHYNLVKSQAFLDGDIEGAFKEAFSLTDLHYLERSAREGKKSGSTALCTILEDRSKIYVAWLGDSMAVLVKNGKPIDIMVPHKPDHKNERKRIEDLGGFVAFVDTWRVSGTLAVSRAIGDPEHKPYISSEPDVVQLAVDTDTDFLIMACDGLWDQLTPEEATSLVYEYICENVNQNIDEISRNVATHLSKVAKDDGSSDNITTIVIFFKDLDQLRATPYTPLTPKETNETNGKEWNHFHYDPDAQSNAENPFNNEVPDAPIEAQLDWSTIGTDSPFDQMNYAKLNFEISNNSMNSYANSTNELKGISNPFNSNDYSYADLNNANKPFDSSLDNNNPFNNESSLLKEPTNSFEINDKLESDISQTFANDCSSGLQSLHSDTQFNISKISDISSSFPTQAVIHSDNALCSTPIQISDPFSFDSSGQQNRILETDMDLTDATKDSNSSPHLITNSGDNNSHLADKVDATFGSAIDYTNDSFNSAQSYMDDQNSFDKTGFQTAYEQDFEQHLNQMNETDDSNETPIQTPIKLEDVCQQVFSDIDDPNDMSNQNQDIHDLSSGAESVDSFCYKKIESDMSKISAKVAKDYPFEQIYDSIQTDTEQQILSKEESVDNKVIECDLNSNSKEYQRNLITEALISEHLSPEEAEEVAQQLTTEESVLEPTNEGSEDIIPQKITPEYVEEVPKVIEFNELEVQEKIENITQSLTEDLIIGTTSQELNLQKTLDSDDFHPEIETENSLQESNAEPIHEFSNDNQSVPEVSAEEPTFGFNERIETISYEQNVVYEDITEDLPDFIPMKSNNNSVPSEVDSKVDLQDYEVNPEIKPEVNIMDPLLEATAESFVDQLVSEDIKSDLLSEEPTVVSEDSKIEEPVPQQFDNQELKTEVNIEDQLVSAEHISESLDLNLNESVSESFEPSFDDPNKSILNFEPLSDNQFSEDLKIENKSEDIIREPPAVNNYFNGNLESEPTPELTPQLTPEPTFEPIPEPTEQRLEPTPEPILEPEVEPTLEPSVELTPEPSVEPTLEPSVEPTLEPSVELTPEPSVEPTPEPIFESICEPIAELRLESTPELISNEPELKSEPKIESPIEEKLELITETVSETTESKPENIGTDSDNQNETKAEAPVITEQIKPKEIEKEVKKETKALASKVSSLKASKPLNKSDPKSKPTTTALKAQPKVGATKTATTSMSASRLTARPASTAATNPSTLKTVAKPLAEKTAAKPSTASTVRRTPTTTTTSRVTTTSSKTSTAAKPTTSRLTPSASATTKTTATSATSKPSTKPLTTRPAVTSRTTTPTTTSPRTGSSVTSRTTTLRANGQASSTTGAAAKPSTSPTLRAMTAPKPTQSTANGVKPVNGVKTVPSKTTTIGVKSATSRLNTGRTAPSVPAKPMASSAKTTKSNPSSAQNKVGVKPISIKGKTETKPVPKSGDAPNDSNPMNGINGSSKSTAVPNRTLTDKKDPLKVSLKQELEDAMAIDII